MAAERCSVVYAGPSFPALHGTRCLNDHPHRGERHRAVDANGKSFWWWAHEEKEAIRAQR